MWAASCFGKLAEQCDGAAVGTSNVWPGVSGLNIEEGHGQLSLQHAGRGDLARDDLAEHAVRIVSGICHDAALPG